MNDTLTQNQTSAPSARRPGEEGERLPRSGAGVIAAITSLAAAALAAVFIPWGNRYEAIGYHAIETSTTAHYPAGFVTTGLLTGVALVLITTTALLTIAAAVAGRRIQLLPGSMLASSTIAALFAALVLPVAVLDGYLAVLPAIAALAAVLLTLRNNNRGTVAIGVGELIGWAAVVLAADLLFSGLGVIAAVVLAFTRLRHSSSAQRWGLGLFAVLVALVHVLILGGGPLV